MKIFHPINSGNRSRSCSESCGARIAQVVGCHSENRILYSENGISNSESCSEHTPELSETSENGLFTPRAFFLKLGSSPDLWKKRFRPFRFPVPVRFLGLSAAGRKHLKQGQGGHSLLVWDKEVGAETFPNFLLSRHKSLIEGFRGYRAFGTWRRLWLISTVGTKIILIVADPKNSEKLLILLRARPCLELIVVSSNFHAVLFLQDTLLESFRKPLVPVKKP